jgi:hypothetical protein
MSDFDSRLYGGRLVPNRGMTISAWIRVEGEQQNADVASLQEQPAPVSRQNLMVTPASMFHE